MERLNSRRLPLRWPEAVALVQELAVGFEEGSLGSVPLVREIAIDQDGRIGLPPSRAEFGVNPEVDPPGDLRRLLGELLNGGAVPGTLTAIVEGRSTDGQPIVTLQDLIRALAFFERPDRQKDLQALATRLAEENEQERVSAELGALTRRTRFDEAAEDAGAKRRDSPLARLHQRTLVAGICVCMLLLVGIVVAIPEPRTVMASVERTEPAAALQAPQAASASRPVQGHGKSSASPARTSETPARANARRETSTVSARPRPRSVRSTQSVVSTPQVVEPATRLVVVAGDPAPPTLPAETGLAVFVAPPVTRTVEGTAVYQSGDPGVVPAVLVYPKLPVHSASAALRAGASILDLVVDAGGRVERVSLRATTAERRYRDYMMLASAKAWIFEPARKDGTPVRYRIEIPLVHFGP